MPRPARSPHRGSAGADGDEVLELLEARGVRYTTWDGWLPARRARARARRGIRRPGRARERVKVVPRDEQVEISRAGALVGS